MIITVVNLDVTRFGQPQHLVITVTCPLVTQYNLISRQLIYSVIRVIPTICNNETIIYQCYCLLVARKL